VVSDLSIADICFRNLDAPIAEMEAGGWWTPNKVAGGAVDQYEPKCNENQIRAETDAIHKGTRHQGRGDDGKHALIRSEDEAGDAGNEDFIRLHSKNGEV